MVNMLLRASSILALVAAAAVLNGCREPTAERPTASQATSTAAPTVPPTATLTATASATPTPVPTHTAIATPSPAPTHTPTAAPPPTPTRTATATPSPLPTHTPTATPSPTPTATATPSPTPRPLTAAEIFARVSPSIVFIESPTATGSGTLLRGGYVLTNAHVVWPFDRVRVVLSDGSEHLDVPLARWDLLADLALLGPISTAAPSVELVDREDLETGSEVFLIGYPGEVERFPKPTITRGIVSRTREWNAIGMTYFQTDATIARGQSGGVLISEDGEVIGISGFTFSEADFGLVASAADLRPRVESLLAGEDIDGPGDRLIPTSGGSRSHSVTLASVRDVAAFVASQPTGTVLDVRVESELDVAIMIVDSTGDVVAYADNTSSGAESVSVETEEEGPHFVAVRLWAEGSGTVEVSSSVDLVAYEDPDDGVRITVGESVMGVVDYPSNADAFSIALSEGETVAITVDAVLVDARVLVDFDGSTRVQGMADDDSGGGLFGTNARIVYRAPHEGEYFIRVRDARDSNVGGYILTVTAAPPDAEAVSPPGAARVDSPFGSMTVYESERYGFSIQHPADWTPQGADRLRSFGVDAAFSNRAEDSFFFVASEDLKEDGEDDATSLNEYVDVMLDSFAGAIPDFELVSREEATAGDGLRVVTLAYTGFANSAHYYRLVYLGDDGVAFNLTYVTASEAFEEIGEIANYSFGTFSLGDRQAEE